MRFAGSRINGTFRVTTFEQLHKDRDLRWACRGDNASPSQAERPVQPPEALHLVAKARRRIQADYCRMRP
jgi:hypothetical protein